MMKYRLIYAKDRRRNTVVVLKCLFFLTGMVYFLTRKTLRVYDLIIWGDGPLTQFLFSVLPSSIDAIIVTPKSEQVTITPVKNSSIQIVSKYGPVFDGPNIQFPPPEPHEIRKLSEVSGLNDFIMIDAWKRLANMCGERHSGCYYHHFVPIPTGESKPGIKVIKNDSEILRVTWTDNTFTLGKRIIFADTGNADELVRFFWDNVTPLEPRMIIGMTEKIIKTRSSGPKFLTDTLPTERVDIHVDPSLSEASFYTGLSLAYGPWYDLKCVYDNGVIDRLCEVGNKHIHLDGIKYIMDPKIFDLRVSKNLRHRGDKRILCLNNFVLEAKYHWVRDFMILCMAIHHSF